MKPIYQQTEGIANNLRRPLKTSKKTIQLSGVLFCKIIFCDLCRITSQKMAFQKGTLRNWMRLSMEISALALDLLYVPQFLANQFSLYSILVTVLCKTNKFLTCWVCVVTTNPVWEDCVQVKTSKNPVLASMLAQTSFTIFCTMRLQSNQVPTKTSPWNDLRVKIWKFPTKNKRKLKE